MGVRLRPVRLEVLSAIDQKHGGFDVVFLAEFPQNNLG